MELGAYVSLGNSSTMDPRLVVEWIWTIASPKATSLVISSVKQSMLGRIIILGPPMFSGFFGEDAQNFLVNY